MRYKIFSNDDDTMYVKSLNPLVLASEFEAQIFSSKEIDRVMYKYGLEEDYTAIETDSPVPETPQAYKCVMIGDVEDGMRKKWKKKPSASSRACMTKMARQFLRGI